MFNLLGKIEDFCNWESWEDLDQTDSLVGLFKRQMVKFFELSENCLIVIL